MGIEKHIRKDVIMKKKSVFMYLAIFMAFIFVLSACTSNEKPLKVMTLKGPTAMGMAAMMKEEKSDREFEIVTSPDQIVPKIVKGEVDLCAVPANLASVIYKKTEGNVQVLNINTLGVLYIVERGENIKSLKDLEGKTIIASGKGASPEYVLKYLLKESGIAMNKVNIEWKAEHSEVLPSLIKDKNAVALLPEPFVTVAKTKIKDLRSALDLTKEWEISQKDKENPSLPVMGVLIARKDVLKNTKQISAFLDDYKASIESVNADPKKAAEIIASLKIVPKPVAEKAIPKCNIVFISGDEMKTKLSGYLKVLFDQNPKSVGGQLPGDDFYWK